jgi:DnaA-like protein
MREGYIFDGHAGSAMLLEAQIRAGQVFPVQMLAWMERHPLHLDYSDSRPPSRPRVRKEPAPKPIAAVPTIVLPPRPKLGPKVVAHVSRRSGVPAADLIGRGRRPAIVDTRRRVVRIMRRLGCSWSEIGRTLQRDHATMMHYITPRTFRPSGR